METRSYNDGWVAREQVVGLSTRELVELEGEEISESLRRAVEGELFERLFDSTVRRVSGRYPGLAPEDLEEIVSDGILRLMRFPTLYDPAQSSPEGYLTLCVSRDASNAARDRKRRGDMVSLEEVGEVALGHGSMPKWPSTEAESAEPRVGDARRVAGALERLPQAMRRVVELHGRGCSHAEIAVYVGRSAGAVRTSLSRGLSRLRAELGAT